MTHLGEHSALTPAEIDIIVQKSVRNTFITLGVDLSDANAIRYVQQDFAYMRRQRRSAEKIAEQIKNSAIIVLVGAVLFALWQGIRMALAIKGAAP